jgi:tetratricopeptide (TPR) repeat protein
MLKLKRLDQNLNDLLINIYGINQTSLFFEQAEISEYIAKLEMKSSGPLNKKSKRNSSGSRILPKADLCQMLLTVADIFKDSSSFEISKTLYKKCIRVGKGLKDKNCLSKSLLHRGNLLFRTENIKEAKKDFQYCKKYTTLKSLKLLAEYSLGLISLTTNSYKDALIHFRRVLSSSQSNVHNSLIGNALLNTGIALFFSGKVKDSQSFLTNSIGHLSNSGNINQLVIAHYFLGYVYLYLNNYNDAIKDYDQALQLSSEVNDRSIMGLIDLAKAKVSFLSDDYKLSLKYLNKAISDFQYSKTETPLAESLHIKGLIYKILKKTNLARGYIQASKRIVQSKNQCYELVTPYFDIKNLKTFDE